MDCVGAFVLPQPDKAGSIRKAFNLSLDTTATNTIVNTAGGNIGNTPNIKGNTTSSSQGITGVDMLHGDSTLVSNNSAAAAGITTTADTAAGTAGTEYSDVQQFDGMPASASFQFVRPPELELEKYMALNSTKMTLESTGTYILIYVIIYHTLLYVIMTRLVCSALSACSCRSECILYEQ
jgi:hypothetical protein